MNFSAPPEGLILFQAKRGKVTLQLSFNKCGKTSFLKSQPEDNCACSKVYGRMQGMCPASAPKRTFIT